MASRWNELHSAIQNGRATILCGAGVSYDAPSNLPLAASLMEIVRDALLGRIAGNVRQIKMRPEAFFEIICRTAPDHFYRYLEDLLSGGQPNRNHEFLAACLKRGCPIITTNFDRLIERASDQRHIQFKMTTGQFDLSRPAAALLKVHGTIENRHSLAVTIDHVGAALDRQRLRTLHALTAGRQILALGYSGLDQFDIIPALASSQHSSVLWITHDPNINSPMRTPLPIHLKRIPRLTNFRANTASLIDSIAPDRLAIGRQSGWTPPSLPSKPGVKSYDRAKIAVDVLMHQNEYSKVRRLVRQERLTGQYFSIADFEARSITTQFRGPSWQREKQQFLSRLFHPRNVRQPVYLPYLAKWADTNERLEFARKTALSELRRRKHVTVAALESSAEILYELVERRRLDLGCEVAKQLELASARSDSILMKARTALELSYYHAARFDHDQRNRRHLVAAERHANFALTMFDRDFINDPYFYHQGLFNLGYIKMLDAQYRAAIRSFERCIQYFESVSINNLILCQYELARTCFVMDKLGDAKVHLDRCLRINRLRGRQYYLGQVLRLRSLTRLRKSPSQRDRKLAQDDLRRSILVLQHQFNDIHAMRSADLLAQVSKSPPRDLAMQSARFRLIASA